MTDDGGQGDLFTDVPHPGGMHDWTPERRSRYESMRKAWLAFHLDNPAVEKELARLALDLKSRRRIRYGMKGLFEVLRWHRAMDTTSDDSFKLNNNYTAFYSRLLMARHAELEGFFELREQLSKEH